MQHPIFLLFFIQSVFMIGCDSASVVSNAKQVGDISGYVTLFDVNGAALAISSGVTVTIDGTSKSTSTNDSGRWIFTNLSAGTYTFTFSKPGYGFSKVIGYQLAGGGMAFTPPVYLSAAPRKVVLLKEFYLDFASYSDSSTEAFVNWPDSSRLPNELGILCIGRDSSALSSDPLNAPFVYASMVYSVGDGYTSELELPQNMIDLKSLRLPSGTRFYAAVCILGGGDYFRGSVSSYYDPLTNRTIYTSPGPHSNIISAVSP